MSIRHRAGMVARTVVPVVAIFAVTACSTDSITGTGANLDNAAISTASTQVSSIVNQPAMVSLFAGLYGNGTLMAAAPSRLASIAATTAKLGAVGADMQVRTTVRTVMGALQARTVPGRHDYAYEGHLVPDSVVGRVYARVSDSTGVYWKWDANQAAPSGAVRFVLSGYDTTTHSFTNTVVGYLDVRDSSVDSTINRLSAIVTTAAGRQVLKTHMAMTGDANTSLDTLSGTITNEQGQSVNYSLVETEANAQSASPRYTDNFTSELSTGAMKVTASIVDGALTATDKQTLTGTIGSTTLQLTVNTTSDGQGGFQYSDTTHIAANGQAIGYAVSGVGAQGTQALNFFHNDGSAMSADEVAALKNFFGAVDGLFSTAFVGFTVLFFLFMIGG